MPWLDQMEEAFGATLELTPIADFPEPDHGVLTAWL